MTATELYVKEICCYPLKYSKSKAMKIDLVDVSGEIYTFTVWDSVKEKNELDTISDVLLNSLKAFEKWIKKGIYPKGYIKDDRPTDTTYHQ